MKKAVVLLPVLLLVAACGKDKPAPAPGTADGEVLQGSVSDAMIPLDTLRSEGPGAAGSDDARAAGTPASGKPATGKDAKPETARP